MLKPKKPKRPVSPKERLTKPGKCVKIEGGETLASLLDLFDVPPEDVVVKEDGCYEYTEFYLQDTNTYEVVNPDYEKQYMKYERDLEKYKVKLKSYEEDKKKYVEYLRSQIEKFEPKKRRDEMDENQ